MNRLVLILLLATSSIVFAEETAQASKERRIGAMVIAIDSALKAPEDKKSLEIIVSYGTDSRHYVMIRGWMIELLKGSESQLNATRDPELKRKHQTKVHFLKKVIRRIDLD